MIREANELDIPRLAIMARAYSVEAKKHGSFPYDEQFAITNVAISMLSDKNCIKLSVVDGKVVGFIWGVLAELPWSRTPIVFDNILYVEPEHRGSAIGLKLIKSYEKWAKESGAKVVSLSIASGITEQRTLALFNKLGYELIGYQCRKEL